MARARYEPEKLRTAKDEVDDLRDEKQEQSLAEMPEDTNDRERHAREVAECISDEGFRRVPAMEMS